MYGNQRQIKRIFPAKKACIFQKKKITQSDRDGFGEIGFQSFFVIFAQKIMDIFFVIQSQQFRIFRTLRNNFIDVCQSIFKVWHQMQTILLSLKTAKQMDIYVSKTGLRIMYIVI